MASFLEELYSALQEAKMPEPRRKVLTQLTVKRHFENGTALFLASEGMLPEGHYVSIDFLNVDTDRNMLTLDYRVSAPPPDEPEEEING